MEDSVDAQKLIVAIVQSHHAGEIQAGLLEADYRVTRINTAGGFLRRGNVTFLIGVHSDQVDEVIDIVKDRCYDIPIEYNELTEADFKYLMTEKNFETYRKTGYSTGV